MSSAVVIIDVESSGSDGICRCLYNQTNKPVLASLPDIGITLISPYEAVKVYTDSPNRIVPPSGVVLVPCGSPGPWQEKCHSVSRVYKWEPKKSAVGWTGVYVGSTLYYAGPGYNASDGTYDVTAVQLYDSEGTPLKNKIPFPAAMPNGDVTLQAWYSESLNQVVVMSKQLNDGFSIPIVFFELNGALAGQGNIPQYGAGAATVHGDFLYIAYNDAQDYLAEVRKYPLNDLANNLQVSAPEVQFKTNIGYIYPNLVIQRENTIDYMYIPVLQNGVGGVSPGIYKITLSNGVIDQLVELGEVEITGTFVNVTDRAIAWDFFRKYRYLFNISGKYGGLVLQGPSVSRIARTKRGIDSNWDVIDFSDPENNAIEVAALSLGVSPLTGTLGLVVRENLGSSVQTCNYFLSQLTGVLIKECD